MARYGSGFREPPWVMGSPKEVMDWVDASHPPKKGHGKEEYEKKFLKNLNIKFDFDVEKKEIEPPSFISKIFGQKYFEEDFELYETTELILRGLAKAKFKNTAKIIVDGKIIYNHPEIKTDLRDTIEKLNDFSEQIKTGKNLEIDAILADVEKAKAEIKIFKIHSDKQHSVEIQINVKIKKEIYYTFLNYIKENIGLKEG